MFKQLKEIIDSDVVEVTVPQTDSRNKELNRRLYKTEYTLTQAT